MICLSVNINKIALLRNSRPGNNPDLLEYAKKCIDFGARGITVHPRPDQRHIRASDIAPLSALVKKFPGVEFNIEGNPFSSASGSYPGLLELVRHNLPDQCTLVPDSSGQLTSDHGFNLKADAEILFPVIRQLKSLGVRTSLFMDPDPEQIRLAAEVGADRIELYTGPFAEAFEQGKAEAETVFSQHKAAAELANALGLGVNAGHDLNQQNLSIYKNLPFLAEVSIGHALTIDSINDGLEATIQRYLQCLQ